MSRITSMTFYDQEPTMKVVFDSKDFVIRYTVKELISVDFNVDNFIKNEDLYILEISLEDLKVKKISFQEILKLQENAQYGNVVIDYQYLSNGNMQIISMEPFQGRIVLNREE